MAAFTGFHEPLGQQDPSSGARTRRASARPTARSAQWCTELSAQATVTLTGQRQRLGTPYGEGDVRDALERAEPPAEAEHGRWRVHPGHVGAPAGRGPRGSARAAADVEDPVIGAEAGESGDRPRGQAAAGRHRDGGEQIAGRADGVAVTVFRRRGGPGEPHS